MPEKLDQTQQHEHEHRIDIGGEENIHPENEDFSIDSDEKISVSHTIFVCILIAAGGFIFGYDTGSIGGVTSMPMYMKAAGELDHTTGEYFLPTYRSSLIIGASTIGGLFGSLGGGQIAERWGRRWGMATASILLCFAAMFHCIFRKVWPVIFVARFFSGVAIGGLSAVCPMYLGETAPTQLRALLVSVFQFLVTCGIFLGELIDLCTSFWKDSIGQYIFPIIFICAIAIVMFLACFFLIPESPRYLVSKDRMDDAKVSFSRVTLLPPDSKTVLTEVAHIKESVDADKRAGEASWGELFQTRDKILYRVLLAIAIMMLQQLSGINYFFFYGQSIFKEVSTLNIFVIPLILGAVNVVGTICCLPIIAKYPRRIVLMTGSCLMFITLCIFTCLGSFALYEGTGSDKTIRTAVGNGMIFLACFFIVAFAGTWAPISYLVVTEMFPQRLRSKAIPLATAFNWIMNAIITFVAPTANKSIGYRFGFLFVASTFCSFFVIYFFTFETRGHSLEDIEEMITSGISARKSPGWVSSQSKAINQNHSSDLSSPAAMDMERNADFEKSSVNYDHFEQLSSNATSQQPSRRVSHEK